MLSRNIKLITILLLLLTPLTTFAWSSSGHRIIAEIAYDNLTPITRAKVNHLIQVFKTQYPRINSFQWLAVWPDRLNAAGIKTYKTWHYIDLPYAIDGVKAKHRVNRKNVVWAIKHAEKVLRDPNASEFKKARNLAFLAHFIGDIHQPLHCITLYSRLTPNGDAGGNLYPIRFGRIDNLHTLWDRGLNFYKQYYPRFPLRNYQVKQIALILQQRYPKFYFGKAVKDLNVRDWAQQSYQLAKNFGYKTKWDSKPSGQYIQQGQRIAAKQITLAGYRLAYVLNHTIGGLVEG